MKKIIAIVGFIGVLASSTAVTSAGYFDATPVIRCDTQITNTLQIGSSGAEVYTLQQMLLDFSFLNVSPNGYFGSKTASAVRAFQRDNGIRATGIVGPATRDAVNEGLCDNSTTGVTIIDSFFSNNNNQYDPFVRVITPSSANPAIYATPQSFSPEQIMTPSFQPTNTQRYPQGNYVSPSPIIGAGIVYNPSTGYTIGIVPQSGSITVSSPVANAMYKEGDTVYVQFGTDNLQTAPFTILLESSITGQSKTVAIISNTSYSFVLTKELIDSVCSGTCNNNQQGSFKVVVTTPTTDIAGITSTLRAAVTPITISRPPVYGQVSITASKTPVNSTEVFRLYVNLPSTGYNTYTNGTYTVKIQALCTTGVTASIAGTPCGQEFVLPMTSSKLQQEVPAVISNTTWYTQNVTFRITAVNALGQIVGTGETTVSVNATPFNW